MERRATERAGSSKLCRTKPSWKGSPNWDVLAFKPELDPMAEHEAMEEIHFLRGTFDLQAK